MGMLSTVKYDGSHNPGSSFLYFSDISQDEVSDSNANDLTMDTSLERDPQSSSFQSGSDSGNSSLSEDLFTPTECNNNPGKTKSIGCRKRKSFKPCRSSPKNDPNFRGVTIRMENKIVNSEWKLLMHATYSLSPKKKRKFRPYVDSSEEEDINNNCPPVLEEKHCASCSAKKTPLWRDAEDGTPLCNACGIRYKKYKMRCETCWHIPKKDEFHPTCQYCGSFYEYVTPRR